ncbi:hypothetical protein L1O03_07995 [Corynebacterium uropygiale]|uniref:Uncharacterized protein n=1 Tax=Corynebacterium uropygiale TaxID=1775911 RepID=A0A9X1U125_9CORY|nr:hypothetical protein [Corynebacterium uropygiale]MCF4007113.1 hypothetical protein [Corynebacterium uropygiale]
MRLRIKGSVLIYCAVCMAVVVGVLLGWWAATTLQQEEYPGVRSSLAFQTWAQSGRPSEEILRDLEGLARAHGESLFVEIPTPEGRTVYGAGPAVDQWMHTPYRGFPGTPALRFAPLTDLPHGEYRQIFELTGGEDFRAAVEDYARAQGIPTTALQSQTGAYLLSGTALGTLLTLTVGFCVAVGFIGVLVDARADAVRRLHGSSWWRSVAHVLAHGAGRLYAILAGALVLLVLTTVLLTNAASTLQWLEWSGVFVGVALAATIIAVALGVALIRCESTTALLAGRLPARTVLTGMVVVRAGAAVAVASLLIGLINYSGEWALQHSEKDEWAAAPEAYSTSLSGARGLEDLDDTREALAARVRELSASGRVLLTQHHFASDIPPAHLDRDVLILNDAAAHRSLRGELLRAYEEAGPHGDPLLFTPDSLAPDVDLSAVPIGSDNLSAASARPHTYAAGSSSAFTWEVGDSEWMNRADAPDPIVVVFPNDNLLMSSRTIVAQMSTRHLLFTSYDDIMDLQRDPEVGSFIRTGDLMSQSWASHHQEMGRITWVYLGGTVAAVVLILIVAIALWLACLKVLHQKLRAYVVHGRRPWRVYAVLGVAELAVLAIAGWFLWYRGSLVRAWTDGGALSGAADPTLIAQFTVSPATWVWTLLIVALSSLPVTALVLRRPGTQQLVQTRR